jgi:hypothetical protein
VFDTTEQAVHVLRRKRRAQEAVAPARDALHDDRGEAAEEDLRATGPGGRGADGADVRRVWFAGPELAKLGQLPVQAAATAAYVDIGGEVVVGAATHADAEGEAATGHPVERGALLGEQRGGAQRRQQHLGLHPDARGGARERGQGDHGFGVVVDEPVQQCDGAVRALVGAPRPGQQRRRVADGQAEADIDARHGIVPPEGFGAWLVNCRPFVTRCRARSRTAAYFWRA